MRSNYCRAKLKARRNQNERDKLSERMCRCDNDDHFNVGRSALNTSGYLLFHAMEANETLHTQSVITVHGLVNNFH
jgi:hypothetical protein